LIDWRIGW